MDIIFRRIEFFLVAQLLAVPVLTYQFLANAKFEATRVVPFVFSLLWRTKVLFADSRARIKAARCALNSNLRNVEIASWFANMQ